MHEAPCRSSGTTLDILHAERRAADHSANIGSKAMNAIDDHPLFMPASVPAPSDKRTRNSPDWNGLAAFLVDLPVPWRPGLAELETFLQAVALHLNRRMKLKSLDEGNLRDTLEACPAEIEALGSVKQSNSERSS
jgi:hypothetical protein